MGVKRTIRAGLERILRQYGDEIVPAQILYEWQLRPTIATPRYSESILPDGAAEYLTPNNPKLIELQHRYAKVDPDVTTSSVWTDHYVLPEDIAYFRGDNAWVWQVRGRNSNILAYALSTYYLKSIDRLGLFDKLVEDNHFGNFSFTIAGRQVSRDLLDSISEIYFLDRHLGIASRPNLNVLDIGAGYGRLAHRMANSLPNIERVFCTDAFAISTFVSDYYLRFRGVKNARVVPLDEIDKTLSEHRVDLALNIHSFSECRLQAIEWWARLLSKHRVKYLMIAPNGEGESLRRLLTNDGSDFLPLLERYGYRTLVRELQFVDPVVQTYGLKPTGYHLLELRT